MKAIAPVLLLLVVNTGGCWGCISKPVIIPMGVSTVQESGVDLDLCPTCVEFAGEFLNELLNIVLNAGVIGGCEQLCALLEEKVPSSLVNVVCNLLCDYVGIEEFINIIEKADLDPIYYCELLKACPIKDDGDAHIMSLTVIPDDVKYDSRFRIEMLFETKKGTGTGEIDLEIDTVDGIPLGNNELNEPLAPGAYNMTWTVKAAPDPNCDPSQGPCEEWFNGNYTANVAICNGECGSKHPHSKIYDTASAPFTVHGGPQ